MKSATLPMLLCRDNCPKCKTSTKFKMFEPGPGENYATYLGEKTGKYYRLDLGKAGYLLRPTKSLLNPAVKKEERLMKIPDEIYCKKCHGLFKAKKIQIDGRESAAAFEL